MRLVLLVLLVLVGAFGCDQARSVGPMDSKYSEAMATPGDLESRNALIGLIVEASRAGDSMTAEKAGAEVLRRALIDPEGRALLEENGIKTPADYVARVIQEAEGG